MLWLMTLVPLKGQMFYYDDIKASISAEKGTIMILKREKL